MEENFKIKLSNKHFSKGDILETGVLTKAKNLLHKILYRLGCRFQYNAVVKGEPRKEGDGWIYEMELKTKQIIIFGIKAWKRKIVKF